MTPEQIERLRAWIIKIKKEKLSMLVISAGLSAINSMFDIDLTFNCIGGQIKVFECSGGKVTEVISEVKE